MLTLLLALSCGPPVPEAPWRERIASWQPSQPIPDVPLLNQHGEPFSLAHMRGSWLAIGFIYTRCPKAEACPMTMQRLVALQEARTDEDLRFLAVTLDPEHDTPERLRAFGDRHGVDWSLWTFATGDPELVSDALPSLFNVFGVPDGDQIDHNVRTVLLEPGLTYGTAFDDNAIDPPAILAAVRGD